MPSDPGELAVQQIADHVIEPVLVGAAVGIGEGDDLAGGGGDAGVARDRKAVVVLAEVAHPRELPGDFRRGIGGTVVHENDFVIGIVQADERFEAGIQRAFAIEAGNHHRNLRRAGQRKIGRGAKRLLNGPKRFLRFPVSSGQAEAPLLDLLLAFEPVVGVTENDRPGQPGAKSRFNLPAEHFALVRFPFAEGIDAEFAQHQGPGIGERLQPGEIIFKRLPVMEVNVETDEVDVLRMQKFSRGKRREGAEAFRIDRFGRLHQVLDEIGHRADAAPADDFRRDLIHHAVGEEHPRAL